MEAAVKLNINNKAQTPSLSIRSNSIVLPFVVSNVIEKSISVNNTSKHITYSKTIEYNEVNSYIEGKVIDVKAQLEINKILRIQRSVYLSLFIMSVIGIIISWIPGILREDIILVLKPLSIAFSFMIGLQYQLGRAK